MIDDDLDDLDGPIEWIEPIRVMRVDVPFPDLVELAAMIGAAAEGLNRARSWMAKVPYPELATSTRGCRDLVAFNDLVGRLRESGASFGADVPVIVGVDLTINGIYPATTIDDGRPLQQLGDCLDVVLTLVRSYDRQLDMRTGILAEIEPRMIHCLRSMAVEIRAEVEALAERFGGQSPGTDGPRPMLTEADFAVQLQRGDGKRKGSPLAARLVEAMIGRTEISFDNAAELIWGAKNTGDMSENRMSALCSRVNEKAESHGRPWRYSYRNGHIVKTDGNGPAQATE